MDEQNSVVSSGGEDRVCRSYIQVKYPWGAQNVSQSRELIQVKSRLGRGMSVIVPKGAKSEAYEVASDAFFPKKL